MTQEEKQLLLVDLCARLPYGVRIHVKGEYHKSHEVEEIDVKDGYIRYFENMHLYEKKIENINPYLRPMSSMTEEEKKEYELLANHCIVTSIGFVHIESQILTDWLNIHHFDYRGLIDRGLDLEAPEGMYKFE